MAVLSLVGCDGAPDKNTQSDEPVKITHCGTGQGTTMELWATNDFPNPTAYLIQLYWFDGSGRQVETGEMTTDAIRAGKSITFTATGRMPGYSEVRTGDVKVLGAQ